jgi:hypothetical protein
MNARRAVRLSVFQTGSSCPEAPPGEGGEGARAGTTPPLQVPALSGGGFDKLSASSKCAHPSADPTDAHPSADPAEAPEGPAMLAGREGSVRVRACSFEVAADSHYICIYSSTEAAGWKWLQGLQVRTACSFEVPAAGPAKAAEAPGMLARREGSDRQAAREGPAASTWLQTITTCT